MDKIPCCICDTLCEKHINDEFALCSEICAIKKYTVDEARARMLHNSIKEECWIDVHADEDSYGDGREIMFEGYGRSFYYFAHNVAFEMLGYTHDFESEQIY